MRILFITKFLPLPADSGGKQRSAALLRRLTQVGEVTLCAIDEGADYDELRDLGVHVRTAPRPSRSEMALGIARTQSVSAGRFASRALLREIQEAAFEPPDCLVVAYAQLSWYARMVEARHKVLDLHNIESSLLSSYAASRGCVSSVAAHIEAAAMRRLERTAMRSFDTVSVVSEVDRDRLPPTDARVLVCPNGWEPSAPLPMTPEPTVAFVALLAWAPNADAAVWMAEAVWPHVRREVPGAHLLLVGRGPTPAVQALARDDVTVTGTVPEIEPYLAAATVAVAPLRAGGGSRLKILEALDAGRPVVATAIGAEGLEVLIGNGLLVSEDADAFASTVVDLLRNPDHAATLGRVGNAAVSEQFSWDATLAPLLADVAGAGAGPSR